MNTDCIIAYSTCCKAGLALPLARCIGLTPPPFNGKEKDSESGFHYYGARYYWSETLTGWLSVDPMTDKYPEVSPYAYCVWNPVKLVDPDGKWPRRGVNIYMLKTTAGVGLGYGLEASWKYGIATDCKGMTHFSAVSTMHLTNQNLNDGSSRPSLEIGLDIGASLGFERNFSFNSFYDAYHSSLSEFSIGGKGIVGGSVGIGDDSFSASIGIGLSLNVSTEQYSIVQSISLSQEESHEVGYLGIWSVKNITKHTDENGGCYYSGTVNDSNIQVRCNAIQDGTEMVPNNYWFSDDYLK